MRLLHLVSNSYCISYLCVRNLCRICIILPILVGFLTMPLVLAGFVKLCLLNFFPSMFFLLETPFEGLKVFMFSSNAEPKHRGKFYMVNRKICT